jgi:tetratricopeptide (TPR) repeat protein
MADEILPPPPPEETPPPPPPWPEEPPPPPPPDPEEAPPPRPAPSSAKAAPARKAPSNRARNFLLTVLVLAMTVAGTSVVYLVLKQKGRQADKAAVQNLQKLEQDYAELQKRYADLETDRNNVLSQTKTLLQEKAQWQEMESQLENLKKANKAFMAQKETLLDDNQRLKGEIAEILQSFEGLKQSYQELLAKQEEVDKENASLRDLLTRQVQATPEYQLLDRESKRLREENEKLGQALNAMESKLKLALDRIKKDQQRELSMLRQIHAQKEMLDEVRSQNESLTRSNQELSDLIRQAPARIKEMAAQNRTLLRETAEMHYNMGVFFTENKQFTQAEREYLRALDFDPNNLKVHYNLGYLYAEDLDKHDKAMFHLEKYLQIDPNSKESEAIRSFITTRQAWNAGQGGNSKKS